MSARSGGTEVPIDRDLGYLRETPVAADNAPTRKLVSRKRDVELAFSQPTEASKVASAIVSIVNPPQLIECVQQLNPRKYLASFKTMQAAEYFSRVGALSLRIAGSAPTCKWLGAERKRIKISFLPNAVGNGELADVLKAYGRVVDITDVMHADMPVPIKTGTRLVDIEMTSNVPNIITVCGFSVPVTYRGVELQCRRCLRTGHLKADCSTPYCDRCRSFGHLAVQCDAPCLKCKAPDHHWKNCTVRSYAFAAASGGVAALRPDHPIGLNEHDEITIPLAQSSIHSESDRREGPNFDAAKDMNVNIIEDDVASDTAHNTDGGSTEDNFESVTEHNSEIEVNITCTHDINNGKEKADDSPGERAAPSTATPCNGPWQSAKQRSKKRKNVSITPDKLPESKKAAVSDDSLSKHLV